MCAQQRTVSTVAYHPFDPFALPACLRQRHCRHASICALAADCRGRPLAFSIQRGAAISVAACGELALPGGPPRARSRPNPAPLSLNRGNLNSLLPTLRSSLRWLADAVVRILRPSPTTGAAARQACAPSRPAPGAWRFPPSASSTPPPKIAVGRILPQMQCAPCTSRLRSRRSPVLLIPSCG